VVSVQEVVDRLRSGDPRALARLATRIENEDSYALEALDRLFPSTGNAHVVGVTGPPGVGKSSLIASLVEKIRVSERTVAVLAVDPSSILSGGALLGDRIRMMNRHADPGVFVRSMASRGRQGGLAWATANLVHLLDAAGFPVIIVETVGTGQDGTDIAALAETVVVVEAPGLGDGVQAIKSGLLEIADVVVVNKADMPGADDALRILRASFELSRNANSRRVPVLGVVSTTGSGVERLLADIDAHLSWLRTSGKLEEHRLRAARTEVLIGLRATLDRRLAQDSAQESALSDVVSSVTRRELSPARAIDLLTAKLLDAHSS
jgi:LAO/AO transport system kinase